MKFFKRKNHSALSPVMRHSGLFHRLGRDPLVDWVFTVIVFVVVSASLLSIGFYKYLHLDQGLQIRIDSKTPVSQSINTSMLDKILAEFDSRDALRENLKNGYKGPADPSI